jgi:hypothetical protein
MPLRDQDVEALRSVALQSDDWDQVVTALRNLPEGVRLILLEALKESLTPPAVPPPPPPSPDERPYEPIDAATKYRPSDLAEARRRLGLVQRYFDIQRELRRTSISNSARRVGLPITTLWRYLSRYNKSGFDGLVPRPHTGRPKRKQEE